MITWKCTTFPPEDVDEYSAAIPRKQRFGHLCKIFCFLNAVIISQVLSNSKLAHQENKQESLPFLILITLI